MKSKNKFLACLLSAATLVSSCPGIKIDSQASEIKTSNGFKRVIEKAKAHKKELIIGGGIIGGIAVVAAVVVAACSKKGKGETSKDEPKNNEKSKDTSSNTQNTHVSDPVTPKKPEPQTQNAKIICFKPVRGELSYRRFSTSNKTEILIPFPKDTKSTHDGQLIEFVKSKSQNLQKALNDFCSNPKICSNGLFEAKSDVPEGIAIEESTEIKPLTEYVDDVIKLERPITPGNESSNAVVEEKPGKKANFLAQIQDGVKLNHVDTPVSDKTPTGKVITEETKKQNQIKSGKQFLANTVTTFHEDDDEWDDGDSAKTQAKKIITFKWIRSPALEAQADQGLENSSNKDKTVIESPYCTINIGDECYIVPKAKLADQLNIDDLLSKAQKASKIEDMLGNPTSTFESNTDNEMMLIDISKYLNSTSPSTTFENYKEGVTSQLLAPTRKKLKDLGIDQNARFLIFDEMPKTSRYDNILGAFKAVTTDDITKILENTDGKKLYRFSEDSNIFVLISAKNLNTCFLYLLNLNEEMREVLAKADKSPAGITATTEDFVIALPSSESGQTLFSKIYDPASDEDTKENYNTYYVTRRQWYLDKLTKNLDEQLPNLFVSYDNIPVDDEFWRDSEQYQSFICLTDQITLPDGTKFDCKSKYFMHHRFKDEFQTSDDVRGFIDYCNLDTVGTVYAEVKEKIRKDTHISNGVDFQFLVQIPKNDDCKERYQFKVKKAETCGKKSITLILNVNIEEPEDPTEYFANLYTTILNDWRKDQKQFIEGAKKALSADGPNNIRKGATMSKEQAQALLAGKRFRPGDGNANP